MTHLEPGRRPFYKYASPEATLAILQNQTVQYSSPLAFNDPFDIQSGLHFDFNLETLHGKVLDRLYMLATAPTEPPVDPHDVWGKIVLEVRRNFPVHGFPRERWETMTAEPFRRLVDLIRNTQQKYQQHWWDTLLPSIRVFCVSEDRDNLLMWAHYAKDHSGSVMEFWSLPEEDNPLSVARSVEYASTPPPFCTESEWLDDMMAIRKLDTSALYRRYAYIKSDHWFYEREWRVWYPSASSGIHDYMPIRQSELKAIYLGCRADPKFVEDAVTLTRKAFPNTRIMRAKKKEGSYGLEHTDI
jgi:hypothetical protein